MTLATITLILAGLGAFWTAVLAFVFLRDPAKGLAMTDHHHSELPQVMTDRYFALVILALAAVLYRDFYVIAFLFAVFSFLGFADAYIYRKAGKPFHKHLSAGFSGALVALLAVLALKSGVTA